jgi:hypothetical protein|nr:MAG TPA: hypothetical protein [Caudoviricetes sp.]
MTDLYDPFDVRCSIDSIQSVVVRAENGEDWPTRVDDLCKSCWAVVMHLTLPEAYLKAAEKRAAFFQAHVPRTVDGDGSDLPADKPSALDQAVAKVKALGDLPSNLGHPHPEDRLALLLGALATLQGAKHKAQTLATIVCVCTTWANTLSVAGGSLDEARGRVESDPDWGGFTTMANLAGSIARDLHDGIPGGRKQKLLTIAHYALAWLADLIEKEEA